MILAQSRSGRASLVKGAVEIEFDDLRIEVPLERWGRVLKHVHSDRKLLGGLLLDFAKHKDKVSAAIADDAVLSQIQRIVVDATVTLVEEEVLELAPTGGTEEG